MTTGVISNWYRPPEIYFGASYYSYAIDIWSAGCIFAELCLKKPIFQGDYDIDQLFKIFK
jgi:serine/threonine protein kinase